eukprot:1160079-Pelagomonas_calceolata.AAC.11
MPGHQIVPNMPEHPNIGVTRHPEHPIVPIMPDHPSMPKYPVMPEHPIMPEHQIMPIMPEHPSIGMIKILSIYDANHARPSNYVRASKHWHDWNP